MRKTFLVFLSVLFAVTIFTACGGDDNSTTNNTNNTNGGDTTCTAGDADGDTVCDDVDDCIDVDGDTLCDDCITGDQDGDTVCDDDDPCVDLDGDTSCENLEKVVKVCYCDALEGYLTIAHPAPNQDQEEWIQWHDAVIDADGCASWEIPIGTPTVITYGFADSTNVPTNSDKYDPYTSWYAQDRPPCEITVRSALTDELIYTTGPYTADDYVADPNLGYGYPFCMVQEDDCPTHLWE